MPEHPRPGMAHDNPDLFAAFRLIAMDRTLRTGRFLSVKRAMREPRLRILQKRRAFCAKSMLRSVTVATVDVDHGRNCPTFPIQSVHGEHYRSTSSRYKGCPVSFGGIDRDRPSASHNSRQAKGGLKSTGVGCA